MQNIEDGEEVVSEPKRAAHQEGNGNTKHKSNAIGDDELVRRADERAAKRAPVYVGEVAQEEKEHARHDHAEHNCPAAAHLARVGALPRLGRLVSDASNHIHSVARRGRCILAGVCTHHLRSGLL